MNIQKITIVACGSAYHTGVTSKYVFEGLARIPVEVDLASEFRYRDPILDEGSLVIVISQSGETADTLAALRESRARGAVCWGSSMWWEVLLPGRRIMLCTPGRDRRLPWPPPRLIPLS